MHIRTGQILLDKRFDAVKDSIESGVVDETKAVGVLAYLTKVT